MQAGCIETIATHVKRWRRLAVLTPTYCKKMLNRIDTVGRYIGVTAQVMPDIENSIR